MQNSLLKDQIALVTGSNRGIGRQVSKALAAAGATVLLGARNLDSLKMVEGEIRAAGGDCHKFELDVTNSASCAKAVAATLARFGKLDVLR